MRPVKCRSEVGISTGVESLSRMKFQNPDWRFQAPGILPDPTVSAFKRLVSNIAFQEKKPQEIYEQFKERFSCSTVRRSTSSDYAEYDLRTLMDAASHNAPLFIESFVRACDDLREVGYHVPSIDVINGALALSGYRIEDDTLIATAPPILLPVLDDTVDSPEIDEYNGADDEEPAEPVTPEFLLAPIPTFEEFTKAMSPQPLKAFLCHSSGDKLAVKKLYALLGSRGYQPWLDEVDLLPGQDWEAEIKKAVRDCHVVIVCLSNSSITKAGFVQKEIKFALDVADEQPEGRIYIIPARLEECPVPARLQKWHWVNLYEEHGHNKLFASLNRRAEDV